LIELLYLATLSVIY